MRTTLSTLVGLSLIAGGSPAAHAKAGESTTVEFPQAYTAAIASAKADGVDFAEVQLVSLTFQRSEFSAVSPANRKDDYMLQFREPLQGKEYWLACFGPTKEMLGGVSCYAIERGSLRLLSTYRGR